MALERLPPELYENVAQHFSPDTIDSIVATSRTLRALSQRILPQHQEFKRLHTHHICNGGALSSSIKLLPKIVHQPRIAAYIQRLELIIIGSHCRNDDMHIRNTPGSALSRLQWSANVDERPCSIEWLLSELENLKYLKYLSTDTQCKPLWQHCGLPYDRTTTSVLTKPILQRLQHIDMIQSWPCVTYVQMQNIVELAFLPALRTLHVYKFTSSLELPDSFIGREGSAVTRLSLQDCVFFLEGMRQMLGVFSSLESLFWNDRGLENLRVLPGLPHRVNVTSLCTILIQLHTKGGRVPLSHLVLDSVSDRCGLLEDLRGLSQLKYLELNQPALCSLRTGHMTALPGSVEELHVRYTHSSNSHELWSEIVVFKNHIHHFAYQKLSTLPKLRMIFVIAVVTSTETEMAQHVQAYSDLALQVNGLGVEFKVCLEKGGQKIGVENLRPDRTHAQRGGSV